MNHAKIIQVESEEHIELAKRIFKEYEKSQNINLCFQGFAEELAQLPGKYSNSSGGILWLAIFNNNSDSNNNIDYEDVGGCIAIKKLEEGICEMKRFYVRENFKGKGLGKRLLKLLLEEAQKMGYKKMRLDTFPSMQIAVDIYRSFGFVEIGPYYESVFKVSLLFMEKNLEDDPLWSV